jgi:hypothetical protein
VFCLDAPFSIPLQNISNLEHTKRASSLSDSRFNLPQQKKEGNLMMPLSSQSIRNLLEIEDPNIDFLENSYKTIIHGHKSLGITSYFDLLT